MTSRAADLAAMQARLLQKQDAKLRRCWFCGEWAWHRDDCGACSAPANRQDLAQGDIA